MVKSTYKNDECIFLLKDLSAVMASTSLEEKEAQIRNGANYSEFITDEKPVSDEINAIFEKLLDEKKLELATYIANVSEAILAKQPNPVLVSLARAGSPIGILIRRYIQFAHNMTVPHYSISIIRDRGIDENALNYIIKETGSTNLVFVDGWTGKGSITHELQKAVKDFYEHTGIQLDATLAVLADPAHRSEISGTKKDICIPNACLNSTVSGLVSRTILNRDYLSDTDFHGAKFFGHLQNQDYSNYFLDKISEQFVNVTPSAIDASIDYAYVENCLDKVFADFKLVDRNKIKLSIGESSRALLRRTPVVMLIKNKNNPDLAFLLKLAEEKGVEVKEYDTFDYECITILR